METKGHRETKKVILKTVIYKTRFGSSIVAVHL
jgi:hypothetical protein